MKNKVFISVVSHGHGDIIQDLGCLKELAEKFYVVVKINLPEPDLVSYFINNNISYIDDSYGLGFGANNNVNYVFCKNHLGMSDDDLFIVLNPDVIVSSCSIDALFNEFNSNPNCKIATINLFRDESYSIHDNSVRNIPGFIDFLLSFFGFNNGNKIDKNIITHNTFVGWCAGSFMAFNSLHYYRLNGFDERFFMYCEDIDICYRSGILGYRVFYTPNIKAVHFAKHNNRNVFSKHFYWHMKGMFIFLIKSKINITTLSVIK